MTLQRSSPFLVVAALLLSAPLACLAAGSTQASAEARANFVKDRAVCMSGPSQPDQAACVREAQAAMADVRRGRGAAEVDAAELSRNARLRCNPLPPVDRADCLARMDGRGTTSGSVMDGGIYRELITREVGVVGGAPTPAPK